MIYAFVGKPQGQPENHGSYSTIYSKLRDGEKLTENETLILMQDVNRGISVPRGCLASYGWCFDLRQFLNQYWVQIYDDIVVRYAPSKKAIREYEWGPIHRIVLVKKRGEFVHR